MGQFVLQMLASLTAALLVFAAAVFALRWQKQRDAALALLDEYQRFDVERIRTIVEKHIPRGGNTRRQFLQDAPDYRCTFGEFSSDLNDEERRMLVSFIQFFERLVLLHESNSVDRRTLWTLLGRQINWWQQHFFWQVEPAEENSAYGIASQVDRIAAMQALQEEPWYSLIPKVRLIPAKPKDRAVP